MDRRKFLTGTAKLGAGKLLAASLPACALGLPAETRRSLWYAAHCCDCGEPFPEPAELAEAVKYGRFWCRFCAEYGTYPMERAPYWSNPPAWV